MTVLELIAAFVLVVGGAIGFTNAVEWLGKRLDLGQGAVGALLAAVGTALPESVIPVVALLAGGGPEEEQIAIGSIIGAPFLLGTLAMLLIAISSHAFAARRDQGSAIDAHMPSTRRDLRFVLVALPIGILVGVVGRAAGREDRRGRRCSSSPTGSTCARRSATAATPRTKPSSTRCISTAAPRTTPRRSRVVLQLLVSLVAIIAGAELFVSVVEAIAKSLGIQTLVLALVLAPLATELPEKANSVLWVRRARTASRSGTSAERWPSRARSRWPSGSWPRLGARPLRRRRRRGGLAGRAAGALRRRAQALRGRARRRLGGAVRGVPAARAYGMNSGPLSVKALRNAVSALTLCGVSLVQLIECVHAVAATSSGMFVLFSNMSVW